MIKGCLILAVTSVAIGVSLALLPSPASWLAATGALAGAATLVAWATFRVNSSFWIETRWKAPGSSRAVALTFDDGPDELYTGRVLDILSEKGVPATFFVVGERVERHPDLIRRAHELGHAIGNHSYTHSLSFHFRHGSGLRREIDACNDAIRSAIGLEPRLFRSPQGLKNWALGDALRERGMVAFAWQARGMDYVIRDPGRIARRVVDGAVAGGVLLLHDGGGLPGSVDRSATIQALPMIIDGLRARGFTFVRADELFAVPAYRAESVEATR